RLRCDNRSHFLEVVLGNGAYLSHKERYIKLEDDYDACYHVNGELSTIRKTYCKKNTIGCDSAEIAAPENLKSYARIGVTGVEAVDHNLTIFPVYWQVPSDSLSTRQQAAAAAESAAAGPSSPLPPTPGRRANRKRPASRRRWFLVVNCPSSPRRGTSNTLSESYPWTQLVSSRKLAVPIQSGLDYFRYTARCLVTFLQVDISLPST
ncbi:hypothetical protein OSTOST_07735, partial [Ostertagia ostertagi]